MKKFKIKAYIVIVTYVMLISVFMWVAISSTIQSFKCVKFTETKIFIRIPKSFICDWENCN